MFLYPDRLSLNFEEFEVRSSLCPDCLSGRLLILEYGFVLYE
jgi:hypothetical protein